MVVVLSLLFNQVVEVGANSVAGIFIAVQFWFVLILSHGQASSETEAFPLAFLQRCEAEVQGYWRYEVARTLDWDID